MDAVRLGINGLGRIGRCALRLAMRREDVEVVGINDLASVGDLAYLLAFDSVHGRYPGEVSASEEGLHVDGMMIPCSAEMHPADLSWSELGADIVIESTGAFRSREDAVGHLEAGARRVLISAPSDDADITLVLGVNEERYDPGQHFVVSMASCTTNCVAPVLKVLADRFGVTSALFTTVHAYTASQGLVDGPQRKRRRGRAGALSLVPTTTGAARATEKVLPGLAGRLDGIAIRAPIPDGSVTDLVGRLEMPADREEVLDAFREAASSRLRGILGVSDQELVSIDIVGTTESAIVDAPATRMLGERDLKVLAWYDNEMGYAARLLDTVRLLGG